MPFGIGIRPTIRVAVRSVVSRTACGSPVETLACLLDTVEELTEEAQARLARLAEAGVPRIIVSATRELPDALRFRFGYLNQQVDFDRNRYANAEDMLANLAGDEPDILLALAEAYLGSGQWELARDNANMAASMAASTSTAASSLLTTMRPLRVKR